jgi:haloalkane dehalogenase
VLLTPSAEPAADVDLAATGSVDGEPKDVTSIVRTYSEWLSQSQIPKLFHCRQTGAVITAGSENRRFCETLENQQEITTKGRHFVQEDSPDEIGAALRRFVIETAGH